MGDLNATLTLSEVWGTRGHLDPFFERISPIFVDHHLVDIRPAPLSSSWTNCRTGESCVAKRLDRCLVHEGILEILRDIRSSTINSTISDHFPIYLFWRASSTGRGMPFKFNRIWMEDPTFSELVREVWALVTPAEEETTPCTLSYKLWVLKDKTKT